MRSFRTLTSPDALGSIFRKLGTPLAFGAACLASLLIACGGGKGGAAAAAPTAPVIGTQPASFTVVAPGTATFTVAASGGTPTYQWLKNGVAVSNATSTSYTTPPTTAADDNASFTVTVSNAVGSTTSATATLHVNFVAILSQPTTQIASSGGTATFSVGAQGPVGGTLHYQWKKSGAAITGATSSSLALTGLTPADMATYTCDVSSTLNGTATGTITTTGASLAIVDAPEITGQPSDQTVIEGNPASFTVTASGGGTLSYQWKRSSSAIAGATAATFLIPSATEADQGSYTCTVTNTQNGASLIRSTTPAFLAVVGLPAITTQPTGATIFPGDALTLATEATGNGVLSYQWRKDGVNLPTGTSASYAIAGATLADDGAYTCVVSNTKYGVSATATTQVATVVVQGAPSITTQPANRTIQVGQTATFSIVAKGANPLSYAWYRDGVAIPSADTDTYTTPVTTLADSGAAFKCVVTNTFGSTTSDEVTLTVQDLLATFKASSQSLSLGEGTILTYTFRSGTTATLQIGTGTPFAVASGGTRIEYPTANTTYTLAVTEGGTTTSFPLNVGVKTYTPKHFYGVNFGSNDIRRYPVDPAVSVYVKAALGTPVATGAGPVHITTSPDEQFLYVANYTASSISAYSADAATGVLTSLGATALSTYGAPWCSAVDPTGTRLYVACDNGIEVFTFNAGLPVAAPALAFPIPGRVKGDLLMHPSGRYLFVLDNAHAKVKVFTIDAATGALSFASEAATSSNPKGLAFDRAASLVFTRGADARMDVDGNPFNAAVNVFSMDFHTEILSSKSIYAGYGLNQAQSDAAGQPVYHPFVPGVNTTGRHGLAFSRKPGVDQLFSGYETEIYGLNLSQWNVDVATGTILGDTWSPFWELGSPYWGNDVDNAGGDSILGDRSGTVFIYPIPGANKLYAYQCDAQGRISGLSGGLGQTSYATGTDPSHGCFRGTLQ